MIKKNLDISDVESTCLELGGSHNRVKKILIREKGLILVGNGKDRNFPNKLSAIGNTTLYKSSNLLTCITKVRDVFSTLVRNTEINIAK